MCLKHSSDRELLRELNKRVNNQDIKWFFSYSIDSDTNRLTFRADNGSFNLDFNQKLGVESAFVSRQIYKNVEDRHNRIKCDREAEIVNKSLEKYSNSEK